MSKAERTYRTILWWFGTIGIVYYGGESNFLVFIVVALIYGFITGWINVRPFPSWHRPTS